jgi:Tfp pilus assembly protein PilF
MVYRDQGDKVNAKKLFEEALKISPDFEPAKASLAGLK